MSTTSILTATLAIVSVLLLPVATCSDQKKELVVTIVANYTPPTSFDFTPPSYRAGSSLTLSCEVEGTDNNDSGLLYEWRSTCGGNCFVRGGNAKTVSTQYLHSYDNGVHTCIVHDRGGCTGNASIAINVVGAGIYVESPQNEVLPNNSLVIEAGSNNPRIPHFYALSGSNRSSVGQLIDPRGIDITKSYSDPFIVNLGNSFDPGMMYVRCFRSLQDAEVGIYTYRTPDESGKIIDVNFGLYSAALSRLPRVTRLDASIGGSTPFLLSCTSKHSPPTRVIWQKDGQQLDIDQAGYKMTQVLVNRVTSTYVSTLTKDGILDDVVGEYSCTIENSLGTSNTRNTTINSITITGHKTPIIVGLNGNINCSTVLNASRLEWIIVGIGKGEPIEETNQGQSLVLSLSPEATELNGAKITCRVITVNNKVFEKTVTVIIKELENMVTIEGSSGAIGVGTNTSLTCVVRSDFSPSIQWLDNYNNPINSSGNFIWTEEPYTIGRSTYLKLIFGEMRSSHGGLYTCKSIISNPSSTNSSSKRVSVKLSAKSISLEQSPSGLHFVGQTFTITCRTRLSDSIDTPVQVNHTWIRSGGVLTSDSRRMITDVESSHGAYSSNLTFNPLRTADSGSYSCQSTIQPAESFGYSESIVTFVSSSDPKSSSITISAVLKVDIRITYSSPDPEYSPPNYRAASSVTLTCVASGTSRSVNYRWSSTCSSCFASSSSSSTISKSYLAARDQGVHTCTATDGDGNTGSGQVIMNIVGSGIYVSTSIETATGSSSGAQPNNSYAIVAGNSYGSSTRFSMYCCSSSTSATGKLIFPSGVTRTSGGYTGYDSITTYSSSSSLAGCLRFRYTPSYSYWYGYSFSFSYPGVYTCSFNNKEFSSIALYYEGSTVRSTNLYSLRRSSWSSSFPRSLKITASTRYSPPTNFTWYKDDLPIDKKSDAFTITTYVTRRSSSHYDVSLEVTDIPDNIVGNYTVEFGNASEHTSSIKFVTIAGTQITCNDTEFVVGQPLSCTCSSDLNPTKIDWYKGNQSSPVCTKRYYSHSRVQSGSRSLMITPNTDEHGEVFRCTTMSPYGPQNASLKMDIEVPNNWSTISIVPSADEAIHNDTHSLLCQVTILPGMNLPISIQWLFQNGTSIFNHSNRNIGALETTITEPSIPTNTCQHTSGSARSTTSMVFHPVYNSDGGTYVCQADVHIPWMSQQPGRVTESFHMPVTTQAKFQLKIYPVTHCSTWDVNKAQELEVSIKTNLEEAVSSLCGCPFNSTAINSGKFNCQPQTCESDERCGPSSAATGPVTYRAIVNGTSDLLTAEEILDYIDTWRENNGTLLHSDIFQLGVFSKKKCALRINSFNQKGC